ncbi:hypothetical protein RI138_14795 [Streptomyces sp. C11-1]|uniref:ApeI dehydratase-like domain-containing protein n=1 Tax=Streptomyces durocortorensis TaxID=2811104 RepID=A0ABY9VW20_9ACTN|nr:hypothetical protein [Streptomyces durocortorensis]WNF27993.1 hypothetical protein RI138_14795 [Streptomyces durocortorensis]
MMLESALVLADVDVYPAPTAAAQEPQAAVVRGSVVVDPLDPALAGHYPGFPLVPGFSLVQYVHDLVAGSTAQPPEQPVVLEKARFLSPVRPGERIDIEARIDRDETGIRSTAAVSADDRPAAEIRIHYPKETS